MFNFYITFIVLYSMFSNSSTNSLLVSDYNTKPVLKLPVVLVIDVSDSMISQKRLEKLSYALTLFIQNDIPDGTQMAMVKFSTFAKVLSNFLTIDDNTRADSIKLIPQTTEGENCVKCGLQKALQLLENIGSGGTVLMATDVNNSELDQDVNDCFEQAKQALVKIITVVMGNEEKLNHIEELVLLTHGKTYNFRDEQSEDELHMIFKDGLNFSYQAQDNLTSEGFSTLKTVTEMNTFEDHYLSTTVATDSVKEEQNVTKVTQLQNGGISVGWVIVYIVAGVFGVLVIIGIIVGVCFYLSRQTASYSFLPLKLLEIRRRA